MPANRVGAGQVPGSPDTYQGDGTQSDTDDTDFDVFETMAALSPTSVGGSDDMANLDPENPENEPEKTAESPEHRYLSATDGSAIKGYTEFTVAHEGMAWETLKHAKDSYTTAIEESGYDTLSVLTAKNASGALVILRAFFVVSAENSHGDFYAVTDSTEAIAISRALKPKGYFPKSAAEKIIKGNFESVKFDKLQMCTPTARHIVSSKTDSKVGPRPKTKKPAEKDDAKVSTPSKKQAPKVSEAVVPTSVTSSPARKRVSKSLKNVLPSTKKPKAPKPVKALVVPGSPVKRGVKRPTDDNNIAPATKKSTLSSVKSVTEPSEATPTIIKTEPVVLSEQKPSKPDVELPTEQPKKSVTLEAFPAMTVSFTCTSADQLAKLSAAFE